VLQQLSEASKAVYELEKLHKVTDEKLKELKKALKLESARRTNLKARQKELERGSQLGLPDTDADGAATWPPANQSTLPGALTIR
jgi:hypothetical protein